MNHHLDIVYYQSEGLVGIHCSQYSLCIHHIADGLNLEQRDRYIMTKIKLAHCNNLCISGDCYLSMKDEKYTGVRRCLMDGNIKTSGELQDRIWT